MQQERQKELDEKMLLLDEKYNSLCDKLYTVLHTTTQGAEYYFKLDGSVYDIYYKIP